jgi:putative lipase involved disintegration of autophagic bodies
MIKDRYGLTIFFDLDGKLYAGLLNGKVTGNEKHRFGFNIVDAKGLEYKDADETKLKIKAISVLEDGTRIEETAGEDNGAERTLFFNDIEDREQLRQLAEQEKNKYKYSGYDGKFRTLLKPYVTSAMTTEIEDPEFGKRSGKYYINSVTTKYGYNGDEKVVEIGSRLS